jgi:Tfp pilus assembly protein PilF
MEDKYFRDARNEIEDMLERYPERWEPLYLKGTCLAMQGKPEQAIPLLNQAIAAEPSAQAYLNLATAHQALFHHEQWITCLRKVVDLDGETGQYGHLAKAHIDEFAASILKSDGISLDQHFAVGRIYDEAFKNLTAGHFDEAIRGFSEVLEALPCHVQSYGNLGLAHAGLGARDRAISCLEKAIELDPDYQPAIVNRRILMDAPNERLAVQSMREIDFYGDRARPGSRRPAARRALAR